LGLIDELFSLTTPHCTVRESGCGSTAFDDLWQNRALSKRFATPNKQARPLFNLQV